MNMPPYTLALPFVGVDHIRFGMSPADVEAAWGKPTRASRNALGEYVEHRSGATTTYSGSDLHLVEIGFSKECAQLSLRGVRLFAPPKSKALLSLLSIEPQAYEDVGMIVIPQLGLSLTGYLHADDADVSVTLFADGRWDDAVAEMKPLDLARLGVSG